MSYKCIYFKTKKNVPKKSVVFSFDFYIDHVDIIDLREFSFYDLPNKIIYSTTQRGQSS